MSEDSKDKVEVILPKVSLIKHEDYFRHDLLKMIEGENYIGIELGVAGGHFSEKMMSSGKFSKFYGVDLYEDHHDTNEYINALKLIGLEKNYVLLRMSFDEALEIFDDHYFDFIYFDGYAHTGEEGGKTFNDWYRKLKVGGIFAGDDYHVDWPLVMWAVNDMVSQLGYDLHVTGKQGNDNLNFYPSWFFKKLSDKEFSTNVDLKKQGQQIRKQTRQANKSLSISMTQLLELNEAALNHNPDYSIELIDLLKTRFQNKL